MGEENSNHFSISLPSTKAIDTPMARARAPHSAPARPGCAPRPGPPPRPAQGLISGALSFMKKHFTKWKMNYWCLGDLSFFFFFPPLSLLPLESQAKERAAELGTSRLHWPHSQQPQMPLALGNMQKGGSPSIFALTLAKGGWKMAGSKGEGIKTENTPAF